MIKITLPCSTDVKIHFRQNTFRQVCCSLLLSGTKLSMLRSQWSVAQLRSNKRRIMTWDKLKQCQSINEIDIGNYMYFGIRKVRT